jgi:hypothetical protein
MEEYISFILFGLRHAVNFAVGGLLGGILIVLALHFTGSLKREHIVLKILTKLYYLYFPLLFFFALWAAGSAYITTSTFNRLVLEVVDFVEEKMAVELAKSIDAEVENYLKLDELPSNEALVDQFLETEEDYQNENSIYRYILRNSLIKTLDYSIGKTEEDRAARRAALSAGVAQKVSDIGFSLIRKELERVYSQILGFLLLPIGAGFIIALILPFIEIILSLNYRKKRLQQNE